MLFGQEDLDAERRQNLNPKRLLMYCRHCGHEVKDKAVICSNCGTPIHDSVEPVERETSGWSWFTMFVTLGVVMLLLLIAIIAGL